MKNNTPHVDEMLIVSGDTDVSTGNIEVSCNFFIKGRVRSGFKILTEQNIQIEGGIENSSVVSREGSVIVKLGITGGITVKLLLKKKSDRNL